MGPLKGKTPETSSSASAATKRQRIAELARQLPEVALTTLAHHIDIAFLREAYRLTRKDGAVGVDGQTADEYARDLEANLQSLLDRLKTGRYRAPDVRRVHIPKGTGDETRPLGIPTFEDKVLQRAVAMILEAIYEQDFLDCSYGFRPGRSSHQAIQKLWDGLMAMRGGWVVEIDIQSFFDTLDHGHLRHFLDRRMRDGVLRRAIDKWLKAGVLEAGKVQYPDEGTPQGGVISPLLANIYLHEVLDRWFAQDVTPRLEGQAYMIRYADDAVLVFSSERDARRVLAVLPKRFGKYGLILHPEKTRIVEFGRPRVQQPPRDRRPGTFDFLGFTHHWGKSLKKNWVIKRRTMRTRLSRALRAIAQWCRWHRHDAIAAQHEALTKKVQGHYAYYGITGNAHALRRFLFTVEATWKYWLNRRSQRARMNWERFRNLKRRYPLPPIRVVHSVATAKP